MRLLINRIDLDADSADPGRAFPFTMQHVVATRV
jgi:hypothetical protein